jgi:predicted ABC-type ATPase
VEETIQARIDFAIETTLSGRGYVRIVERLKRLGWSVDLYYIALPSVEMSKTRVAERVAHGGHDIPLADIERRFPRSLHNLFNSYTMIVDRCVCYLNKSRTLSVVFEQSGTDLKVYDKDAYEHLERQANFKP